MAWLLAVLTGAASSQQSTMRTGSSQPNIIFILSDDQDLHMDSLSYMPYLKKHITDQGTTFQRHYCTVALCCPSRVSLWTGKAAHNTNVTDVNPPYGGYPKFVSQGLNSAYLPLWLQALNYSTYYVGKLFNAQNVDNYASPRAAGWTGSEFLLDPYTYEYLNATFVRNHEEPVSYEGEYSTDVLASKAFDFLEDALHEYKDNGKPFFLTIAPTAPHSNVHMNTNIDGNFTEGSNTQSPPIPAARHAHLFDDVVVPRMPHFNPSEPQSVSWISRLPQQNQTNIDFNDHFYRSRLQALQAVDEMIDTLFSKLDTAGVIEETYIFFSTDNGYHIGQHRLQPGKQCPFEEDVNIPFIVRGPGIPKNTTTDIVTTHTDLAPTFLKLAGGELREDFDGQVIPLHGLSSTSKPDHVSSENSIGTSLNANAEEWTTEHINIESWGVIMSEGNYGSLLYPNHTYKALRVIGERYSFLYTVWCSGEHELYDLVSDPYEMQNLYGTDHGRTFVDIGTSRDDVAIGSGFMQSVNRQSPLLSTLTHNTTPSSTLPIPLTQLLPRLDALLMVLKTCKARACTHPWDVLHPPNTTVKHPTSAGEGDVKNGTKGRQVRNLADAMSSQYHDFYASQQKVAFEKCEKGYILESEGPVWGVDEMWV
ncbi:Putative sulfatase, alkaline-phosphatase-like, core domain superfamily [Septoria linicola]|uniref:Arylsulfatase n=1 Tax=Septoria linicola TaxID=215465 RepID=A0A9Q9EPN1_9PEZI|nr:Putative sulfatase, alkaline-phosphatase-like, core domain superfamily [Septoria linicola]